MARRRRRTWLEAVVTNGALPYRCAVVARREAFAAAAVA
jgi:hypothetical protein